MKPACGRHVRLIPRAGSVALALATLFAATESIARGAARSLTQGPRVLDVRYAGALDVTAQVRDGLAAVPLPFGVVEDGRLRDVLLVGDGFVHLGSTLRDDVDPRGAVLAPSPAVELGARLDVLVRADLRTAREGAVLVSVNDQRVAVRWTGLRAAAETGGVGVVEAILEPSGAWTAQYLHVPAVLRHALGGLSLDGVPLTSGVPEGATSWRLESVLGLPELPREPPQARQTGPPPRGCDPEAGSWCDRAGTDCALAAGTVGYTACSATVETTWSFNEGDYCRGCAYTFYVLVECGREMHLPVFDMEGLDLTVSEVLTGSTPDLRCWNDAARGNAPEVIRCVGPGGQQRGYGPAFDVTSTNGTISWGFPDCVSGLDLTCGDIPAGGGTVNRVSPGEFQTMDCYVQADAGLCGLYRLDIRSGGFEWDLFSNCTGAATPQFEIFSDCTAAWAAFEPLPELAVANVVAQGTCPGLDVTLDVQNIGCVDHVGGVTLRISDDCATPDSRDYFVPDPIAANGSITVTLPFTSSCDPVRVDVIVDPADAIPECTESTTVAACRQDQGIDTLSFVACGCTAQLQAAAGADRLACAGDAITLTGAASIVSPCARPLYRWLDAGGNELRGAQTDPTFPLTFTGCPAGATFTLEVSCDGETCVDRDDVRVDCLGGVPGEATDLRVTHAGPALTLTWSAAPGAATHLVARGDIGSWYSHGADTTGRGACDTGGATTFTDPDDAGDGADYYYVVIGVSGCGGGGGTAGFAWDGARFIERPPASTPSCP